MDRFRTIAAIQPIAAPGVKIRSLAPDIDKSVLQCVLSQRPVTTYAQRYAKKFRACRRIKVAKRRAVALGDSGQQALEVG